MDVAEAEPSIPSAVGGETSDDGDTEIDAPSPAVDNRRGGMVVERTGAPDPRRRVPVVGVVPVQPIALVAPPAWPCTLPLSACRERNGTYRPRCTCQYP